MLTLRHLRERRHVSSELSDSALPALVEPTAIHLPSKETKTKAIGNLLLEKKKLKETLRGLL